VNVAQLIKELEQLPPGLEVGLASDAEGNSINQSADWSYAFYDADGDWEELFSGYIYDNEDNETLVTVDTANAIIIWPV